MYVCRRMKSVWRQLRKRVLLEGELRGLCLSACALRRIEGE